MFGFLAFVVKRIVSISLRFEDGNAKLNKSLWDKGLVVHFHNYYHPFVSNEDIAHRLDLEREIIGLNLDISKMRSFLGKMTFADELVRIPDHSNDATQFSYKKGMFGPGDAEIFYGIIRHLRPARIIEVGAGSSTLVARLAIRKNQEEDPSYSCKHVCIEPFENPWLESLGIEIIREKVERVPVSFFRELNENDILFIDSSHTVRPQGDVLFEVFRIYGALNSGVYVHVHDIFTPRDYPADWVLKDRRLWHEQYVLEAYLCFNEQFEIVCALNWLWKSHPDLLRDACPVLTARIPNDPGSFWMRRVSE